MTEWAATARGAHAVTFMTDHDHTHDAMTTSGGPSGATPSLLATVRQHAAQRPHHPAYVQVSAGGPSGRPVSYAQLDAAASHLAERLATTVSPGSAVLLCCPNVAEFAVAMLAILHADCAVFPVSPASTATELQAAARQSRAAGVIGIDSAVAALNDLVPRCIPIDDVRMSERGRGPGALPASSAQPRLLLQSSGTTGLPKIVCRSGHSLDAVCAQMVRAIGMDSSDAVLATVPLCHSYGLEHGLLAPLYAGATVRLCAGLDLQALVRELADRTITILPSVPAVFEMLAGLGQSGIKCDSIRAAYSAGGPLPAPVYQALVRDQGLRVGQLYGATELGSLSWSDPRDPSFDPASVGRPMDGVEIRIEADEAAGATQLAGREGQVLVRARSMFSGYLGGEDAGLRDGFFPTGDLGRIDDRGNLTITGRIKLLIDVGGHKVNPLEVEQVLGRHPQVGDCVVVGLPQTATVSRLRAVVTPADPARPPDPLELRRFARQHLTGYKVPRIFEVRDALPRSPTGKILRHLVEAS